MTGIHAVYCVNWREHEGSWDRPDGHTLHRDLVTAKEFIDGHPARVSPTSTEFVTCEAPFLVEVSPEVYAEVQDKGTIWGHFTENRGPR